MPSNLWKGKGILSRTAIADLKTELAGKQNMVLFFIHKKGYLQVQINLLKNEIEMIKRVINASEGKRSNVLQPLPSSK